MSLLTVIFRLNLGAATRGLAVLGGLALGFSSAQAENWPQWRGPASNGSSPETGLPVNWSATSNVAWVRPLPGWSGSTPVTWGDRVFLSTPDGASLSLMCVSRKDGSVLWQRKVAAGEKTVNRNNLTSPSPVTDGQRVVVLYATGDLAAFDLAGQELWHRQLARDYGSFGLMWIYGSSPLLYQNRLYVQVLERSPAQKSYPLADDRPERESYLLCLDPATGANLWRHIRKTDAVDECMEAYSTPLPSADSKEHRIIVFGGDYVTSHDALTGAEIWRCGGYNPRKTDFMRRWYRVVPSPVPGDGQVFVCGPKGEPVLAIRENGQGLVTETHLAWKSKEATSDCPTPLYYQKRLFVVDGAKRTLACLDPATGAKQWSGSLGVTEQIWASPTGADGRIYMVTEKGTVVVVEAGAEFKILATHPLDEFPTRSSVVVSGGQLFLRTGKNLYCITGANPNTAR